MIKILRIIEFLKEVQPFCYMRVQLSFSQGNVITIKKLDSLEKKTERDRDRDRERREIERQKTRQRERKREK